MLITEEVSGKFRSWLNSSSMAHAREAELEIYDNYLPKNLRAGDGGLVRQRMCTYRSRST